MEVGGGEFQWETYISQPIHFAAGQLLRRIVPSHPIQAVRALPTLMALVYLFAIYKISQQFTGRTWLTIGLLGAFTSPFLLDWFNLARGYGLSTAFGALSLAYILDERPKYHLAAWCAVAAGVCQISFLPFAAAIWIYCIWKLRSCRYWPLYIITFAWLAWIAFSTHHKVVPQGYSEFMQTAWRNPPDDHPTHDFLKSTATFANNSFFHTSLSQEASVTVLVVAIILMGFMYHFAGQKTKVLIGLAYLTALVIIGLHYIKGVDYQAERHIVFYGLFWGAITSFAAKETTKVARIGCYLILFATAATAVRGYWFGDYSTADEKKTFYTQAMAKAIKMELESNSALMSIATSDGLKWSFWYYLTAELGMDKQAGLIERYCANRISDRVFWYEMRCGRPRSSPYMIITPTTHMILDEYDQGILTNQIKMIKHQQFPNGWALYRIIP
jgi:hypothetical protein